MRRPSLPCLAFLTLHLAACVAGSATIEDPRGVADELRARAEVADFDRPAVGRLEIGVDSCSGTLIGERTVLTAAHCVEFASERDSSCTGLFWIQAADSTSTPQPFRFSRCQSWTASSWVATALWADLAVLQLDTPVPPSLAQPLPLATDKPEPFDAVTVYGYGLSGADCELADFFAHKRRIRSTPRGLAFDTFCPGDSGGPLVDERQGGTYALVSSSFIPSYVDLAVELSATTVDYRPWIMKRLDESERGVLLE